MRRNLATKTSWRKTSFDIEKQSHHIPEQTLCRARVDLARLIKNVGRGTLMSKGTATPLRGIKR